MFDFEAINTQLLLMQTRIEDVSARLFSELDYPIALNEIKNEFQNYLSAYQNKRHWDFKSEILNSPSKRMFALSLFSYLMFEDAVKRECLPDIIGFIADTNYRLGIACECTSETELKIIGAKKANLKFEGNKKKAIDFYFKNIDGKGHDFKTRGEAAHYMADNSILDGKVKAKTITDKYLVGIKKPTC
jgi:hypothetical protein